MPLEQIINNERKFVNETLTVGGGGYESIPAGHYQARFDGLERITTDYGKALLWCFTVDEGDHKGKSVTQISDDEKEPSVKNRTGKFLCALKKSPIQKGVQANPSEYVGKRYFLVVEQNSDNPTDTKITTFSMID